MSQDIGMDRISGEWGYPLLEVKLINDYWAMNENQRLKRVECGERIAEALRDLSEECDEWNLTN